MKQQLPSACLSIRDFLDALGASGSLNHPQRTQQERYERQVYRMKKRYTKNIKKRNNEIQRENDQVEYREVVHERSTGGRRRRGKSAKVWASLESANYTDRYAAASRYLSTGVPSINMSLTTIIYPRSQAPLIAPGPWLPLVSSFCSRAHV